MGQKDAAAESRRRRLSASVAKPIRSASTLWQNSVRASTLYFPTEDLANLLRGMGIKDAARLHDIFNLVTLPVLVYACVAFYTARMSWGVFAGCMYAYFGIDLLWVVVNPSCVKSPSVIIGHHILTMCYILMPVMYAELRRYVPMNLIVELNTFFLILRRLYHVPPVSVCFYITWFSIRLGIYPYLIWEYAMLYLREARRSTYAHPFALVPIFQIMLTVLNIKWTVDLVKRKLETLRNPGAKRAPEKGL